MTARATEGDRTQIALLHATFADAEEAARIARATVEERLAACANILGACASVYRWEGAVETAEEVAVLFKTRMPLAPALAARIAALHGYTLPAIEYWPATVSASVGQWVADSTRA